MSIDDIITELGRCPDRAELVAFMAPLRLPSNLDHCECERIYRALASAAARCWKRRFPA